MVLRSFVASLAAALFVAAVEAQDNCPREKAQHFEGKLEYGLVNQCGGVTYSIGGLSVAAQGGGCPAVAIYTPPHDLAVKSDYRTLVSVASTSPITMLTFTCKQDWFLIFPVGSSCTFESQKTVGNVTLLTTQACPEPTRT